MKFSILLIALGSILAIDNHVSGEEPEQDIIEKSLAQSRLSNLDSNQCAIICASPGNAAQQGCFCFTPAGQSTPQGIPFPIGTSSNRQNPGVFAPPAVDQPGFNNFPVGAPGTGFQVPAGAQSPSRAATVMVFTTVNPLNGQPVPVSSTTILPGQNMPSFNNLISSAPTPTANTQARHKWFPVKNDGNQPGLGWASNTYFPTPTRVNLAATSMAKLSSQALSSSSMSSSSKGSSSRSASGSASSSKSVTNMTITSSALASSNYHYFITALVLASSPFLAYL